MADRAGNMENRREIARLIRARLENEKDGLREAWARSMPVRHIVCDDLLPPALAREAFERFPDKSRLVFSDDIRERKYAGADTGRFPPLINDILFAFQDPAVIDLLRDITGLAGIQADPTLYASGLSIMEAGGFLNPHIDNSHDAGSGRYRILNALYYVTPGWQASHGGSLELWEKPRRGKVEVPALFNRLILMQTDRSSWHSVGGVRGPGARNCISNYYFSERSPEGRRYRHVTTFRARPEQGFKRILFGLDSAVRNALGLFLSNRTLLKLRNAVRGKGNAPWK